MILTLCGSARFEDYWHEANKQLGLAGHICFSIMTFPSVELGEKNWHTDDQKWTLDLAHFAKIEESDGIVLLNVGSYLGESSLRELKWARMRNKLIFWSFRDDRMIRDPMYGPVERMARGLTLYHASGEWTELTTAVEEKIARREADSNRLIPS